MPNSRTGGMASAASRTDEARNAEKIGTIEIASGSPS
jgi:hypothetical protein